MKRRTAIKYLGALAGAAAAPRLLGCSTAPGEERNPNTDKGLTTLVVVCMENRSYDHFLGARSLLEGKGGDGLRADMTNLDKAGKAVPVFPTKNPCVFDPPHGWDACHGQFAGGMNSGFIAAYEAAGAGQMASEVMGYMTRAEIPISWALADGGAVCDRWFCSLLGPTWPNRMYLHSAQSGGLMANVIPGAGGLDWPSIWHRLNDAGVPWTYYFSNLPFVPLFKGLDVTGHVKRVDYEFFDDAAAGTLPPVVFIDPAFDVNDDHPPLPPVLGQQLLASIYQALATSPQWPNITLVITYDEHGGFFDHVPPPAAADDRQEFRSLGFRVPTLVVGPYVKPGYVSSVVYDHSSVLAHIEKTFSLKPLTARDAAAADLSDVIDQARLKAREPLPPVKLPMVQVDPSVYEGTCKMLHQRSDLALLAESGFFPPEYDRRADGLQILRNIGARLAALQAMR